MSLVENKFDERRQKAFDFSAEATKQLITVATGIIAFTVTFSKDFVANVEPAFKWLAIVAWIFYFFSVIFGLLTMYALSGQLEPGAKDNIPEPSIWGNPVNLFMKIQQGFFLAGLFVTLIFGGLALYFPAKQVIPNAPASTTTTISPIQPSPTLTPEQAK